MNRLAKYYEWLHGKWPAGKVEKLPQVGDNGQTNVPEIRIVGDLIGIPLLKFASDTGAKAIKGILQESNFAGQRDAKGDDVVDVAIIGAGVSGVSAAIEAQKAGLSYVLLEASQLFSTVVNFPKAKPIFTYPTNMTPDGGIQYTEKADVKETLLEEMQQQVQEHDVHMKEARIEKIERKSNYMLLQHAGSEEQTKALRVIVAIGRSGNFRKLDVPGEDLEKVSNRLHDPKDFCESNVLVVGGGDSAMETAIALAICGANVTLSYRGKELSRPKPENIEKVMALAENPEAAVAVDSPSSERQSTAADPSMRGENPAGSLTLALETTVTRIEGNQVVLRDSQGNEQTLENDYVFAMIGREAPLDFFRRSGINVSGDRTAMWWTTFAIALLIATFVYHWKKGGTPLPIYEAFSANKWFPFNLYDAWAALGNRFSDLTTVLGTLRLSVADPGFYYSTLYCLLMLTFGIMRVRRRKTPYVTRQTWTLVLIQIIPLFFLPYIIFPWMGHNGMLGDRVITSTLTAEETTQWKQAAASEKTTAIQDLLPEETQSWGAPESINREHWTGGVAIYWPDHQRSLVVNTPKQLSYLRDDSRASGVTKHLDLFPPAEYGHGREYWRAFGFILAWPLFLWNLFTDQPLWGWLAISLIQTFVIIPIIVLRWGKGAYCGWICSCGGMAETLGDTHRHKMPHGPFWNKANMIGQAFLALALLLLLIRWISWIPGMGFLAGPYKGLEAFDAYFVDLIWAGIIGFGLYFHLSGRVWCRFGCPLAALMHIYARFGRFRIFAEKKKCISCNVCTSVCHQGIDVMNFANKGIPMEDPQCVRCSACVQQCPTGVLSFGRLGPDQKIILDSVPASPVQMAEERNSEST